MKEFLKKIKIFVVLNNLRKKIYNRLLYLYSPELMSKKLFKCVFNYDLNLSNPVTFNEKIMWLKLNYCRNNNLVKQCVSKFDVREYIKYKGLEKILVNLLGVYDDANDIDISNLPEKFVLKCTNGCDNNLIVKDKNIIDKKSIYKLSKKWLKSRYEYKYAEVQYEGVKNRIICEEYLGDNIVDYKFFCFNGEPKFLYLSQDLSKHGEGKIDYVDLNFNSLKISRDGYQMGVKITKPKNYQKMIKIAKTLSEDFPFVRVDLYNIDGKIYFSELTFVPTGGLMKIIPEKYDYIWGNYLKIDNLIHQNKKGD